MSRFKKASKAVRELGHTYIPASERCKVPRCEYSLPGKKGIMIVYDTDNKTSLKQRMNYEPREYLRWVKSGYKEMYQDEEL